MTDKITKKVVENQRQELWIKLILRNECKDRVIDLKRLGNDGNIPNKLVYVFKFFIYLQPHFHVLYLMLLTSTG
jgi:hypothetical protein